MLQQIEISRLDLRFEGHRLKNKEAEMKLLTSISENGIRRIGLKVLVFHLLV